MIEPKYYKLFSERELEILALLAAGVSNEKIGNKLFISVNTVKTHIQHIYLKLEVNNRTEAATKALAAKIINSGEQDQNHPNG